MAIHKVQRGETLSAIAQKYGTTVSAIQKANSQLIKNVNSIQVGWSLTIPTSTAKNYDKIGKQVEKVMQDINNLDSFKSLLAML